jgi:hypothetical protein
MVSDANEWEVRSNEWEVRSNEWEVTLAALAHSRPNRPIPGSTGALPVDLPR